MISRDRKIKTVSRLYKGFLAIPTNPISSSEISVQENGFSSQMQIRIRFGARSESTKTWLFLASMFLEKSCEKDIDDYINQIIYLQLI